jgi:hypothetical protein
MSYATVADLETYCGAPANPGDDRLLQRASELVDELLVATAYTVDSNGNPTNADAIAAMRDATCAQVEWWRGTGDELGATALWDDLQLGPARLMRRSGGPTPSKSPRFAARTVATLHRAGLLPGKVSLA